ncbi:MAG: hypothetical protein DBX47_00255 [Clostridiales bacterium]|nr:MAG: hypothetical protein DBX47_00255 [Clostridiales bacterium]
MGYNTKQRESIISFFEKNKNQSFTASQIIKNKLINVGNATVFRYLAALSDEGILRKTQSKDGSEYRFAEDSCKKHLHLQCLSCGQIDHMDCCFMDQMNNHIINDHHFKIDNTKTVIYGTCDKCRLKEKQK